MASVAGAWQRASMVLEQKSRAYILRQQPQGRERTNWNGGGCWNLKAYPRDTPPTGQNSTHWDKHLNMEPRGHSHLVYCSHLLLEEPDLSSLCPAFYLLSWENGFYIPLPHLRAGQAWPGCPSARQSKCRWELEQLSPLSQEPRRLGFG